MKDQWQHALGLMAVVQKAGLVQVVIAYLVANSASEGKEQRQHALGLLEVMQKVGVPLPPSPAQLPSMPVRNY